MHLFVFRTGSDCLFWVSSLAYPNLLGTKGYVVVVVVVTGSDQIRSHLQKLEVSSMALSLC
jgi:hypothetical protein